jgi:hypothetical protein
MTDPVEPLLPNRLARTLREQPVAPDTLMETTMHALTRRGLLSGASPRWLLPLAAAASLAIGMFAGTLWRTPEAASPPQASHLLLLYEDAGYRAAPAGREHERVEEYTRWAHALAARGRLADAAELGGQGWTFSADATGESQADSTLGTLTGFFLIAGADAAEAQRIARECPHLRHGGRVVLRPLVTAS